MSAVKTEVTYGNFIGGTVSPSERTFLDLNPADKTDVVGSFPLSSGEEVAAAVDAAQGAFALWKKLPPIARGRYLTGMAQALRGRGEEIATAITREQGKPLAEARAELAKAIEFFDYYGIASYDHGGRTLPSARAGVQIFLQREPLGVVAAITPWNVPVLGPARKIAPALVCGNTVVLKPSKETPLSSHFLVEAAIEAGLPDGVMNVVYGHGSDAGGALVVAPRVRAISFTGSSEIGAQLARVAAERLIRVQLELGGKNAAIVLDDCDLESAATHVALAAFGGSGQQCTATSRVLVHRRVLEPFIELLVRRAEDMKVGSGLDPEVSIGPLVSEQQLNTVLEYVDAGLREGAELLLGGRRLSGGAYDNGWFTQPTVFAGVTPDMRIAREEIFGPVVAILAVGSDAEAIDVANDTEYGLSAAVYTSSLSRAYRFIGEIEVGALAVNLPSAGWEIQTPFGGVKASGGTGWKEQGIEGLAFFSELKAVQMMTDGNLHQDHQS